MDLAALKITQVDLVKTRGYIVPEEQEKLLSKKGEKYFTQWLAMRKMSYPKIVDEFVLLSDTYENENKNRIYILFARKNKEYSVGIDVVKDFINNIDIENNNIIKENSIHNRDLHYNKYVEAILVVDGDLTSDSRKFLFEAPNPKLKVQVYHYKDLVSSPLKHKDCPKFRLLSDDEKREKFKEMKVNAARLNIMFTTDPIAKYCNWPEGSIVCIYHNDISINLLNPASVNYRVILEPNDIEKVNTKKK
jgi:DNA-directed RNA polymerase subunit H (RpoH/RPB5)